MLCALRFFGIRDIDEKGLSIELKTNPETGVESDRMERVAKNYGVTAKYESRLDLTRLESYLKNKKVAILDYQAWRTPEEAQDSWKDTWTSGHYAVLQAMDNTHLWLMDPWLGRVIKLRRKAFLERWHDKAHGKKERCAAIIISR